MEKSALRPLVLEILRKTPQTHLHAIETEIRKQTDAYQRHDVLLLQEVLWELLVQGVLAPGKNSLNLNLPFVHVTEFGASCLEEGAVLAYDPDGYVARIASSCNADPMLVETTREALLAFLAGRYPSSTVMLGRAVELLLDRLANALIRRNKRTGHGVQRLEAARPEPVRLLAAIRRALPTLKLPADLDDDANAKLSELEIVIGGSGSPDSRLRLPQVDRESALARLLLFPGQCRTVYRLIGHLDERPPA